MFVMSSCCAETESSETQSISQVQLIPAVSQRAPSWSGQAIINSEIQELSSQKFEGKYLILYFYPYDFSLTCPIEFSQFSDRIAEFQFLDSEVVAVSTDSIYTHFNWVKILTKYGGIDEIKIPLLSDKSQKIAKDYGVLNENEGVAYRALFVIDRENIIRHMTMNDENLIQSMDEILRIIKACISVDNNGSKCQGSLKTKHISKKKPDYFGTI